MAGKGDIVHGKLSYGKMNNLKGFSGVIQGFEIRRQIELNLIK